METGQGGGHTSKSREERREQILQKTTLPSEEVPTLKVNVNSAGKLLYFIENWKHLTSNHVILSWVQGYKIPFSQFPAQVDFPKVSINKKEHKLYDTAIQGLLGKGAITSCRHTKGEFLSSYFLVPKSDGGFRFVLNLKKLNMFINAPHFKLEDYRTVLKLLTQNCFMAKIDLKDAYFAVPVDEGSRKFLRFKYNNILYEFKVLPFGLNIAPFVFTKLLKPIFYHLRSRGFLSICYLDDILLIDLSYQSCLRNVNYTVSLLSSLGFTINLEKSVLTPSHKIQFLGFTFDSNNLTFSIPQKKKNIILDNLSRLMNKKHCKIKHFASLIGQLVAVCPVVKYSWLYIKQFEREKWLALLKGKNNYNEKMFIPDYLNNDFLWWIKNIQPCKQDIKESDYTLEIFTDASPTGWGAFCKNKSTHGFWNSDQQLCHINYLELVAAFCGLKSFSKELKNCKILLRIDNKTAISCINRMGSVKYQHLNDICRNIWQWCEMRNMVIFASYIKSKENVMADLESRCLKTDTEYSLNDVYINNVFKKFGQPVIDLFASEQNTKCQRYISWKPDPGSEGVDAFTLKWDMFFYAFPPFAIISKVLSKIITEKAEGIVIVPEWPNQPWFPVYNRLLTQPKIILGPDRDLILSPSRLPHPNSKHLTLAVGKLSGKLFEGEASQRMDVQFS